MLSVLVEGTLTAAPVQRTSARGQPFVTAQMRTTCDDGESILCSLIAFHAAAAGLLAALAAGDTVAVAGPAALSRWEKDGEQRVGLKVTATRVLTVYDAGMRRRTASAGPDQAARPDPRPSPPGGTRQAVRAADSRPWRQPPPASAERPGENGWDDSPV
jgi:single-stranded DNA-binding protein